MTGENVNLHSYVRVDPAGNTLLPNQNEDHLFSKDHRISETNCSHFGCRSPSRLSCSIICLVVVVIIGAFSALIALFLTSKSSNILVSHPLFTGCSSYPSSSQIHQTLTKLQAEFGPTVKLETIGQSFEKRNLTIARLSTNFTEKKPKVWIQCGAHGRETTTPVTCLTFAYNLAIQFNLAMQFSGNLSDTGGALEQEKNTERTCIFESESWKFPPHYQLSPKFSIEGGKFGQYEFIILPLVNPDGYQFALRHPPIKGPDKLVAPEAPASTASVWSKHPGCWSGEPLQKQPYASISLSGCKDECHARPSCQGVVRKSEDKTGNGICYLRKNLQLEGCEGIPRYDLYQKMDSIPHAHHASPHTPHASPNAPRASPLVAPRLPPNTNDGYGNPMWRKNRNNSTNDHCQGIFQAIGIDLNRNYDVAFDLDLDERKDPCSNGYGGAKPFSEPETRAIRDKLAKYKGNIAAALDIHSFMPAWLYPTQYKVSHTNHSLTTEKIVSLISSVTGARYSSGSGPSLTYFCSGTFMDWAYENLGCHHSYTVEIRSPRGSYLDYKSTVRSTTFVPSDVWKYFQPEFSQTPQISDEAWVGLLALLDQL